MRQMETEGVIYVASGARYLDETESAATLRRWMPDVDVCLFTNDAGFRDPLFTDIVVDSKLQGSFRDKITAMSRSPFGRTLFLDTDTHACRDLAGLFALLDRCSTCPRTVAVPD
jgi:hypothetical protein